MGLQVLAFQSEGRMPRLLCPFAVVSRFYVRESDCCENPIGKFRGHRVLSSSVAGYGAVKETFTETDDRAFAPLAQPRSANGARMAKRRRIAGGIAGSCGERQARMRSRAMQINTSAIGP